MIKRLLAFLNRLGEMLVQGAIIRYGGDDDTYDVIDHKTGKPKQ